LNAFYGFDKNANYLKNVVKDFNESNSVILNIEVPIWDWGSHEAKVERELANLKREKLDIDNTRRQLIQEIKDVVSQFKESKRRLKILEKNVELAQKSYDISLERFNNGDITSEELALAQNRLSNAKLTQLNAQIDYLNSIANLKKSTYWDFEKNEPVVKTVEEKQK